MHHDDVAVRESDPGVEGGDPPIIPLGHPAEVDVGDRGSVELKLRRTQGGEVVGHHHRAHDRGDMVHLPLHGAHLVLAHGGVGRPEIHRSLGELLDPAARSDRLIVDLDPGLLVVRVEPLAVDRVRERGPGPRQGLGGGRAHRRQSGHRHRLRHE